MTIGFAVTEPAPSAGPYEAAWEAEEIPDYYHFPGSRMRMLDDGKRWTRRIRAGVKPMTRDGARVAFKQLEAVAKIDHVPGRDLLGVLHDGVRTQPDFVGDDSQTAVLPGAQPP